MIEQEKKELRDRYIKEYKELTGNILLCIEKKRGLSYYKNSAKRNLLPLTAGYLKLSEEKIKISRKHVYTNARMMVMYLLYEMKATRVETGKMFDQDHTTVTRAINTVAGYLEVDEEWKQNYEEYKAFCMANLKPLDKFCRKLTKEQVAAIQYSLKKGGITQEGLATIYNVGIRTIRRAFKGEYQK